MRQGAMLWGMSAGMVLASMGCGALTPVSPAEVPPASEEPVARVAESTTPTDEVAPAVVATDPPTKKAPAEARGRMLANAAMVKSGNLVDKVLVKELQSQLSAMHACVPLIRQTDVNVGSLNLELTIAGDGSVKPHLRSPTNPEAERCLLDAARAWRVTGPGSAMVLLMIQDGR